MEGHQSKCNYCIHTLLGCSHSTSCAFKSKCENRTLTLLQRVVGLVLLELSELSSCAFSQSGTCYASSSVSENREREVRGWRVAARVTYTAGEKQLCLLTSGSPARVKRVWIGSAHPSLEGWLWQIKVRRARSGRAETTFAVWPRPVTVWWNDSPHSDPEVRNDRVSRSGRLLCRFMLTRLRGCWREEDRPRAPKP